LPTLQARLLGAVVDHFRQFLQGIELRIRNALAGELRGARFEDHAQVEQFVQIAEGHRHDLIAPAREGAHQPFQAQRGERFADRRLADGKTRSELGFRNFLTGFQRAGQYLRTQQLVNPFGQRFRFFRLAARGRRALFGLGLARRRDG